MVMLICLICLTHEWFASEWIGGNGNRNHSPETWSRTEPRDPNRSVVKTSWAIAKCRLTKVAGGLRIPTSGRFGIGDLNIGGQVRQCVYLPGIRGFNISTFSKTINMAEEQTTSQLFQIPP